LAPRDTNPEGWRTAFGLDLRSLALFRIALGICLGADLIRRLGLIETFYSDQGPVIREAVFRFGDPWTISLHFMGGGWELQTFLVWVGIICAAGIITGYRTRLCTIVSWVLLCSLHARDPLILNEGDVLLRLLLFWAMLLPVGGRFSLDRALTPSASGLPVKQVSIASAALILQICAVYWVAALRQPPSALRALEIFGPVLVLATAWTPRLRLALLVALLGLHAALGATGRLGSLPWVLCAALLALLPGVFWTWVDARGPKVGQQVADRIRILGERLRRHPWTAMLVPPPPQQPGRISSLIGVAAAAIVVLSLLEKDAVAIGVPARDPGLVSKFASLTQLGQRWTLLPAPRIEHEWYVFEGVRADGSRVDVWSGGGASSEAKPSSLAAWYRNAAWATYLTRLHDPRYEGYRSYLGYYFCLSWNAHRRTPDRILAVDIDYMAEPASPSGQPGGTPVRIQGWRQLCPVMNPFPPTWWF
jgi:hypothetical protein